MSSGGELLVGLGRVPGDPDHVSLLGESALDEGTDPDLILDDQNSHGIELTRRTARSEGETDLMRFSPALHLGR